MKDPKIVKAYDDAAPDEAAKARILQNILAEKDAPRKEKNAAKGHRALRVILPAAAAVALIAALSVAGFAAKNRKWRLPAPESYTPDPEHGIVSIHETNTYDAPPEEGAAVQPLSDEDFLRRAVDFLRTAGLEAEVKDLTVARQKNLYWDREEVEVRFDREGVQTSVKFDAESGYLLGFHGIDWGIDGASACATQAEADALARHYYESLPVAQGYVMTGCEKYDEQYWSYDFCREAEPGLMNPYEMVRIAINPVSGQLVGCTVFYVPLLDDHEPGDAPLTQDQAEAIARQALGEMLEGNTLAKAEKVIGMPNWNFTDYEGVHAKASGVTRLCWGLTFEGPNTEYTDQTFVLVDLYTGEVLGGDSTK